MPITKDMTFSNPLIKYLGYLVMGVLLVFSILFYQERTLFVDVAFQTFKMITEGGWQVQVYRFGSAIIHALPLAAIQLKLPLSGVLLVYSVSFTLLYLALYHITIRWLKNEWLGLGIALLFTLNVYDGFYWATSELQQGLAFLLVFFAFVLRFSERQSWWYWLVIILGIPFLILYHPVIFIPFAFIWGFIWLSDKRFWKKEFYFIALFMVIVVLIKPYFINNWYDANKMNEFNKHLHQFFPNYLAIPSHKIFITNSIKFWYFFPLFFIIDNIWYLWQKKWMKIFWLVSFSLGFILLTHIGSPHTPYRFYAEVNYMPLTIFVVIPFLFDIVPYFKKKHIWMLLFSTIFVIRLVTIYHHHQPYTNRISWMQEQLDKGQQNYTSNRFVIPFSKDLERKLYMTWGIPYESLLLSSMDNPKHSATLFVPMNAGKFAKEMKEDAWFISDFTPYPLEEIDDNVYFNLEKGKYLEIQ